MGIRRLGVGQKIVLGFRQKKERANRFVEIEVQIARILGDADDFVLVGRPHSSLCEISPDGVHILEKLARKCLIDYRYAP